MQFVRKTFLTHPETGVVYTVQEAAEISGVAAVTLYKRIKKGWNPSRVWAAIKIDPQVSMLPPDSDPAKEEALLAKIPNATAWDLM